MTDLKSLTLPEMTAFLQSLGEPAFRGRQVFMPPCAPVCGH